MEGGRQLVSDSSSGTCSFGHVPTSRQLLHAAQSTDQPYAVAPGDFLIADSDTWNELGAYPDIINTAFLDYLQPCRMVGAGLKEVKGKVTVVLVAFVLVCHVLSPRLHQCTPPSRASTSSSGRD